MKRRVMGPAKREQGQGLLLALLVLVVMMTALGVLASVMKMGMLEDRRDFRTVSLVAMSDAVMAETLAHLAQNESFKGVEEHPFGEGTISSEVRSMGASRVEIVALATYGGQERRMRASVLISGGPPTVTSFRRVW